MPRCLVLLFLLSTVTCDSTFRFGAVLSTTGPVREMEEAKNGYQLYIDTVNAQSEGNGFFLQGKADTVGFYFNYSFHWREDSSDPEIHTAQLRELIEDEEIHFLGGSHPAYAEEEMRIADENSILNYHCCVGPDVFYEHDYPTVFGIPASNIEYTRMLIRTLALADIAPSAIVYDQGNTFTRTTCEAALGFSQELGTLQQLDGQEFVRTFNSSAVRPKFFKQIAQDAQEQQVQVLVACVFEDEGKLLVDAFHDIQYPLRATFLTVGPTKMSWVNSFDPPFRANDLFSAAQWHRGMKYADSFFGTTLEYAELYEDKFEGLVPTYLSAGASAVGLTLTRAIEQAFQSCDISGTEGDVEALLYDPEAIECDDLAQLRGYDRVVSALANLDEETFLGRVKFNYYRRNVGLDPVTTQVFARTSANKKTHRHIEAVLPLGYATELINLPAGNPYKETCLPGYYVDATDPFDPCIRCGQGEVSRKEDARHCDSCPIGEWNNRYAQSECVLCPSGTTTEVRGAKRRTDCMCKPGFFNIAGELGVPCEVCPEGASCAGGTAPPIPDEGYWANETFRSQVYECDPESNCLGGENLSCEEGHTGRLCSECVHGYFSVIQTCYRCLNAGLIVLFYVLLLLGWYVINVIVSRSVASLEMILGWAQLANIIGDINLRWTTAVIRMFGVANILDFDVDILEPSCLTRWGFMQNFITQLCLPILMTFMGCSGYFASAIAYLMVKHQWIRLEGRRKEILSIFVEVPENEEELKKKADATIATFLASVDIMYVTIAKYCFDVFKCETIAGVSVLRVSPNVVCDNSEHKSMIVLASTGIVFYVIGYLVYISWKLYDLRSNRTFADPVNLRRFGFVYQKYELDYWYTPAIMIIRKLLFVMTLVYMNNPAFQVGTLAIIINASLMIHVYTAPYVDTYLDVLFSFLLVALMFEAFGGLMFYSENLPDANRQILQWIILITLFVLIIVFVVIFGMEMSAKYHIRFLKSEHRKFAREKYGSRDQKAIRRFNIQSPLKTAATLAAFGSHQEDKSISFELLYTFQPGFVSEAVRKRPEFITDWDRLTNMLKDYMSDQSETSYLSMDPMAKFWRKLVDRFPELVDFLAVADDETRDEFNRFATKLYRNFYLTNKVMPLPLMDILNWRDYAPMAQWLAIAPSEDRKFFVDFVSEMFRTNGNTEAADMLECKAEHGGEDPELENRQASGWKMKKKKRILQSLSSGAHPFHHSAAERQLSTATSVAMAATRFRNVTRRESSGKDLPLETEAKDVDSNEILPEGCSETEDRVPEKFTVRRSPDATLSNQPSFQSEGSSTNNKSVSFSAENVEGFADDA